MKAVHTHTHPPPPPPETRGSGLPEGHKNLVDPLTSWLVDAAPCFSHIHLTLAKIDWPARLKNPGAFENQGKKQKSSLLASQVEGESAAHPTPSLDRFSPDCS